MRRYRTAVMSLWTYDDIRQCLVPLVHHVVYVLDLKGCVDETAVMSLIKGC